MKYLNTYPEKCIGCMACMEICSGVFFKEKNVEKSSIKVVEKDGRHSISVCNQCGDCIKCCPAGAISKNPQGVVVINKTECVGCLICVAECPTEALFYHVDEQLPFKCIACGVCVGKCPIEALELVKEN